MRLSDRLIVWFHASGACAVAAHGACAGTAGRSDGRPGLCWCRCHEPWLTSDAAGDVGVE
jgi:hypothetical protein